jgi:hypothetical protein
MRCGSGGSGRGLLFVWASYPLKPPARGNQGFLSDGGIAAADKIVHMERPAGVQQRDDRRAAAGDAPQQIRSSGLAAAVTRVLVDANVVRTLRIQRFGQHRDDGVGARRVLLRSVSMGSSLALTQRGQQRRALREVGIRRVSILPIHLDRRTGGRLPAAAPTTSARRARQRQQPGLVFEQHALSHR